MNRASFGDPNFTIQYTFIFYKKVSERVGAKTFLNFWTFWGINVLNASLVANFGQGHAGV